MAGPVSRRPFLRRDWLRHTLALSASTSLAPLLWLPRPARADQPGAALRLARLEDGFAGRLGVFALDTASGVQLSHRGDERFPMCSTFKLVLAAAVLQRSLREPGLMQERLPYARSDLVPYSPITEPHVGPGMTAAELCAATVQVSDNTAANVLLKRLGGPAAVTAFARSIGDDTFRLDRWEPGLNTALPGDPRDTTTPAAMARSVQRLVLGDALPGAERGQLQGWLRAATTGGERIRASTPGGWSVGDKTGTGAYGTANDVAVLWPPRRAPVVLVVFTTHTAADAKPRSELVAAAAAIVVDWVGSLPG